MGWNLHKMELSKCGTIEFRQHDGTLDIEEITMWIEFGFAILLYALPPSLRMQFLRWN